MLKTIIFDFDNTLYDTEKRKEYFWQMASAHGYSQVEAYRIYNQARIAGDKITISLERYLENLQSSLKTDKKPFLEDKVNEILIAMEATDNLIPGARELLDWCLKQNLQCYLLSLGAREWQEMKFEQSGLARYFLPERVVFTDDVRHGKVDAVASMFGGRFDGSNTVLVNDKPDETRDLLVRFPKLYAIVRREIRDIRFREKNFTTLQQDFSDRLQWTENLATVQSILSTLL